MKPGRTSLLQRRAGGHGKPAKLERKHRYQDNAEPERWHRGKHQFGELDGFADDPFAPCGQHRDDDGDEKRERDGEPGELRARHHAGAEQDVVDRRALGIGVAEIAVQYLRHIREVLHRQRPVQPPVLFDLGAQFWRFDFAHQQHDRIAGRQMNGEEAERYRGPQHEDRREDLAGDVARMKFADSRRVEASRVIRRLRRAFKRAVRYCHLDGRIMALCLFS